MKLVARVWRHVPAGAEPLHLGRLLRLSEGRWNERGEYAGLYTALTREGALAELEKVRTRYGSILGVRDLVSIDVTLEPVLDLRDARNLSRLAAAAKIEYRPDQMTAEGKAAYRYCHRLAAEARKQGYTGLLVPSAAMEGQANLVIYFDIVAPKQLEIDNGPDRATVA